MSLHRSSLGLLSAAAVGALACSAAADDVKSNTSEIELGPIPQYSDEASARSACQPDSVVWADTKSGFYYPKFFAGYGKTQYGVFTRYTQAKKADYWGLTPASDGGHRGREFPVRKHDCVSV
jgi:hypothetical protein